MKALFPVLGAVVLLSTPSAQAQAFKEIMQDIGLQPREQHKMDFSERAPLVIPPSTDALPPPEDSSALASVNPNWPTDPETLKELEEAEKEKIPQHLRRKYREDAGRDIYEIQRKEREAKERGEIAANSKGYDTTFDRNAVLTPAELKEVQERRKNAPPVSVYAEPERKRLTDPPPGYRIPSADQPFGPGEKEQKKKDGIFSKLNPFD